VRGVARLSSARERLAGALVEELAAGASGRAERRLFQAGARPAASPLPDETRCIPRSFTLRVSIEGVAIQFNRQINTKSHIKIDRFAGRQC